MLREINHVAQEDDGYRRRWFLDDYFDLIIWENENREIHSFELTYDLDNAQKSFAWRRGASASYGVDDGESRAGKMKSSAVALAERVAVGKRMPDKFKRRSAGIEERVAEFVHGVILDHAG
jgi:hypothetical protein